MIRYFQLISPKQARAVRLLSGQLKNCTGFNLSIQDSNRSEADLVSPAHILTGHEVDGRLRWIWFQSDVNFPSSLLRPPAVNRANRGGSDATHHSTQLTPVQSAQKKIFPWLGKVLKCTGDWVEVSTCGRSGIEWSPTSGKSKSRRFFFLNFKEFFREWLRPQWAKGEWAAVFQSN